MPTRSSKSASEKRIEASRREREADARARRTADLGNFARERRAAAREAELLRSRVQQLEKMLEKRARMGETGGEDAASKGTPEVHEVQETRGELYHVAAQAAASAAEVATKITADLVQARSDADQARAEQAQLRATLQGLLMQRGEQHPTQDEQLTKLRTEFSALQEREAQLISQLQSERARILQLQQTLTDSEAARVELQDSLRASESALQFNSVARNVAVSAHEHAMTELEKSRELVASIRRESARVQEAAQARVDQVEMYITRLRNLERLTIRLQNLWQSGGKSPEAPAGHTQRIEYTASGAPIFMHHASRDQVAVDPAADHVAIHVTTNASSNHTRTRRRP